MIKRVGFRRRGVDLIGNADTVQELDEVVTSLRVRPMMETTIKPLTTFGHRRRAVLAIRERLAKRVSEDAGAAR